MAIFNSYVKLPEGMFCCCMFTYFLANFFQKNPEKNLTIPNRAEPA